MSWAPELLKIPIPNTQDSCIFNIVNLIKISDFVCTNCRYKPLIKPKSRCREAKPRWSFQNLGRRRGEWRGVDSCNTQLSFSREHKSALIRDTRRWRRVTFWDAQRPCMACSDSAGQALGNFRGKAPPMVWGFGDNSFELMILGGQPNRASLSLTVEDKSLRTFGCSSSSECKTLTQMSRATSQRDFLHSDKFSAAYCHCSLLDWGS